MRKRKGFIVSFIISILIVLTFVPNVLAKSLTIKSINSIKSSVYQGDYFNFPSKVTATMSNGSKKQYSITWNSKYLDTDSVGTRSFYGTVKGYSKKVKLTVVVKVRYMSDIIKPFGNQDVLVYPNQATDMGGEKYYKGYTLMGTFTNVYGFSVNFNLGGNYKNLNGLLGLTDDNYSDGGTIEFYGDGVSLGKYTFTKGDLPTEIDLDVTGVRNLKIEAKNSGRNFPVDAYFANAILYK